MNIAFITDIHYGCRGGKIEFADIFKEFLDNQFFPYLEEYDVKYVICLGDFTDSQKSTDYRIIDRIKKDFLDVLNSMGIPLFIIPGNHDVFYKNDNSISSIKSIFEDYDNVNYIEKPTVESFDSLRIQIIPWINKSNYSETMDLIHNTHADWIAGHFEIAGMNMYKDSIAMDGMDRSNFHSKNNSIDRILSGHFHHRSKSGIVEYIGAAGFYRWNDYDDVRGFAIVDTETKEIGYVDNEYSLFVKIDYDDSTKQKFDFGSYAGKYVKLIVKNKENPRKYNTFLKKMYEVDTIEIKIIDETIKEIMDVDTTSEEQLDENLIDTISDYVNSDDFDNKELAMETIKELYEIVL